MNTIENTHRGWDDELDGQFFRITSSCFSHSFCNGASALLASYDADEYGPIQAASKQQLRPNPDEVFIFQPSA